MWLTLFINTSIIDVENNAVLTQEYELTVYKIRYYRNRFMSLLLFDSDYKNRFVANCGNNNSQK